MVLGIKNRMVMKVKVKHHHGGHCGAHSPRHERF